MHTSSTDRLTEDEIRRLPVVLTVEQAAGLLRIGRSKAYQAVKSEDSPTRIVRVGRCIRIPAAEVLGLLGLSANPDLDKEQQQQ